MTTRSNISIVFLLLCMACATLHAQVVTTVPMPMCSSRIDTLVQVRSFNGVAADNVGYVYLTEWNSGYILKWAQGDTCMQVVESLAERTKTRGAAPEARVPFAHGLTADHKGNLYVTAYNGEVVRKITPDGQMSVIAAGLGNPNMVIVDDNGNLYISDEKNHVIKKVTPDGTLTTFAGITGSKGYAGDGRQATEALLNMPYGLAMNSHGELYIADTKNNVVRMVSTSGTITTIAGNGRKGYTGDGGPATAATLNKPMGMAIDGSGNLYIADEDNHVVRRVSAEGIISTYIGTGEKGHSPDGLPPTKCRLNNPRDVTIDRVGNLFVIDFNTDNLRRVHMLAAPVTNDEDDLVNVSVNSQGELEVKIERGMYFSASVRDSRNAQVLEIPISTNPQKIEIQSLPAGSYSLILRRNGRSKTVSFVKSE